MTRTADIHRQVALKIATISIGQSTKPWTNEDLQEIKVRMDKLLDILRWRRKTMTYPSKVRDFVVGIDYDSIEEDKGHITIRRKVTITELVEEIKEIMLNGSRYPQFPPEANPSVTYAWDLSNQEDGDCYHEIINELEQDNKKEML